MPLQDLPRINHTEGRWGGGVECQLAWVYRAPLISVAAHLCYNILTEPLDFACVGEREEKACHAREHSSRLLRSVSPRVTDEAQRALAAHVPQVSDRWSRARVETQANLARGPTCFLQLSMPPHHDCRFITTHHHCESWPSLTTASVWPSLPTTARSLCATTAYWSLLPYYHVDSHWWILVISIF